FFIFPVFNYYFWGFEEGRAFSKLKFECATVVGKKKLSGYKTQPSIFVQENNGKVVEIIQELPINYDFNQIELGDKIYKKQNTLSMLRLKQNGDADTITYDAYDWVLNTINFKPEKADYSSVNCY
ncbi:MAG TPA: hypothetical protein VGF79_04735, partial [Bacteroidia bacterium]